jgi:hypothetical protein
VSLVLTCIFGALAAFHLVPLIISPLRDPDWFWPDPKVHDLIQPDPSSYEKKFVLFPITHFLFGIWFLLYTYLAITVRMGWPYRLSPRLIYVVIGQVCMLLSALRNDCIFGKWEKRPKAMNTGADA